MTRILLCAEGKHDAGEENVWDAKEKEFSVVEGWLQPLIRSVLGMPLEFKIKERSSLIRLKGEPKPAQGHGGKSYLAKRSASIEGHDVVIFMADADSANSKRYHEIVQEISSGFKAFHDDKVGCIACVPMSASEAWLLADRAAWEAVWGEAVSVLPDHPESIWGNRDDPDGDHPHRYFFRVCSLVSAADNTETRRMISEAMSVDTLRQRCPLSFVQFETDLRAAAGI